jgi:esterase/lipase superfamily enzyme
MRDRTILSRRAFLATGTAFALAGCNSTETTGALAGLSPPNKREPSIIAVTTRKPIDGAAEAPWFGAARSGATRAVRVVFEPLGSSLIGRVAASVTGRWRINRVEALGENDPIAALAGQTANTDVLIYVHGYNTSFETSVIGVAEIAEGIGFRGTPVAFSWPSKADLLDYGYDRESALWSRDAMQDMLEALAKSPSGGKVHIIAHSMGTLLTLETLRQFWSANGTPDVAARIGAIVFAAPDIDIDLFAASLPRIGPLARHLTVFTSTGDRALAVSRRLAGGVTRVGSAERDRLEQLGVRVVDASGYGWGLIGHDVFISNSDVRAALRRAVERGAQA